jgi:hypothetical protein
MAQIVNSHWQLRIMNTLDDRASEGEHLTALLQIDPGIKRTAQVVSVCEQVSGERDAQRRLESLLADVLLGGDLMMLHSNMVMIIVIWED